MYKRRKLVALFVAFVLLLLPSCTLIPDQPADETSQSPTETTQSVYEAPNTDGETIYAYEDFAYRYTRTSNGTPMYMGLDMDISARKMESFEKSFPAKKINKAEELQYTTYTIYNNGKYYRAFAVFERFSSDPAEMWIHFETFYMNRTLSYLDFSNISAGSTMDDVNAVDPVAGLCREPLYYTVDESNKIHFSVQHLLKDGILKITYVQNSWEDAPIVEEIVISEDFSVESCYTDTVYSLRVELCDYVNYP
jgi:hypothetical protein